MLEFKKKTLIPEDLFDTCVNMGITVHECLGRQSRMAGNQFINRMGGYTVLTSSVRVISSRQAVMKRTMDYLVAESLESILDRHHYNIPCSGNLYCFTGANLLLSDESRKKRKII
ncbi:MAG: hypothetical protein ACLU00_10545 [Mediterraneibacter faecis]